MKAKVWVEFQEEVNVTVTTDDIVASLLEQKSESFNDALRLINSCACVLRGIPHEIIDQMNEHQRKIVRDFFNEQAERYPPPKA